jgi:hypothetical protein
MGEDEARTCVAAIRAHLDGARKLLLDLYERRGWVSLGYPSWRACVEAEFGWGKSHAYRQLDAAEAERDISPNGEIGGLRESHLRPLVALPDPDLRREALARAQAEAPDGRLTAALVERAVAEVARGGEYWRSTGSSEWHTPPHVLALARELMGTIDLDPASLALANLTVRATRFYTVADDGLAREWHGRVWLNPPFGRNIGAWVAKMREGFSAGHVTEGLLLVPCCPETGWWELVADRPWCAPRGRLSYINPDDPDTGAAPKGHAIFYFGAREGRFVEVFRPLGRVYRALS